MNRIRFYLASGLFVFTQLVFAQQHDHKMSKKPVVDNAVCQTSESHCAKTMTTAFAPNGDLWRLWVSKQQLHYQVSSDLGKQFSSIKVIGNIKENIAARNENRPKIGFDNNNGVYLSWAVSGKQRFTGDIRFSYSLDGGKSFTKPVTVNNDGYITGHSFNEMSVTAQGEVSIVWLDSRYRYQQKKAGKEFNGSEIYLAKTNPRAGLALDNTRW